MLHQRNRSQGSRVKGQVGVSESGQGSGFRVGSGCDG